MTDLANASSRTAHAVVAPSAGAGFVAPLLRVSGTDGRLIGLLDSPGDALEARVGGGARIARLSIGTPAAIGSPASRSAAIDDDTLERIKTARARARAAAWAAGADPGFYVIDIDATLVEATRPRTLGGVSSCRWKWSDPTSAASAAVRVAA